MTNQNKISELELSNYLENVFLSSEEIGDIPSTCYSLSNTNLTLDELAQYCKMLEPHVHLIEAKIGNKTSKTNLLSYALEIFYSSVWTGFHLLPDRGKVVRELKNHLGIEHKYEALPKRQLPKTWIEMSNWLAKERHRKDYLNNKFGKGTHESFSKAQEDDFDPDLNGNDIDNHNPFVDRNTFDALTDGQLGRYEDFQGTLDDLKAMLGRD